MGFRPEHSTCHKLVHITTVPKSLGFLRGQIDFMHWKGLDVHAISSPGEELSEFGQQEGVTIHAITMQRRITPIYDIIALVRLCRLLRHIRPVIVHAHTPKGGLLGMLAAWFTRVPVRVYHIHGLPLMTASGLRRVLLTWSERISCMCAHQIFCVSPSLRQVAIELDLCPENKTTTLGSGTINGIDARSKFNPATLSGQTCEKIRHDWGISATAYVIGFVGRIVRDKGVADLVNAWALLKTQFPDIHLIIAGEFEYQDPIEIETENILHTDPHIHLLGNVRQMPAVYAAIDVVVLPTYREGFGLVLAEASSMELPVVATAVPGCVDAVVDGITGTLVSPHNPEALASAITRYLDNPNLRRRHGQAGRERVLRDFRPEDIWEATYQEYTRLLQEKGLPLPTPREE
ncbi:MAG: glycosyltransferase family 4 protein [Anaerolineae bacterium]|nr:glycosyltransferase family 4 protein [Anaerolineae bacterium]